jgi:hypothetical protein
LERLGQRANASRMSAAVDGQVPINVRYEAKRAKTAVGRSETDALRLADAAPNGCNWDERRAVVDPNSDMREQGNQAPLPPDLPRVDFACPSAEGIGSRARIHLRRHPFGRIMLIQR